MNQKWFSSWLTISDNLKVNWDDKAERKNEIKKTFEHKKQLRTCNSNFIWFSMGF